MPTPGRLLIDTDLIIEYLRGHQEAIDYLENLEGSLLISVINVAELYAGLRDSAELHSLEHFLHAFEILPVSLEVGRIAGWFRRDYGPSHGTGLADALIGATAQVNNATLITFNARHYPMLPDVRVPYVRS